MDSCIPVELIFDQAIGDLFSIRIGGNVATEEIVGSLEFALAPEDFGTQLCLVLGHTDCGAVAGACDVKNWNHQMDQRP